jgi:hypothetical protein
MNVAPTTSTDARKAGRIYLISFITRNLDLGLFGKHYDYPADLHQSYVGLSIGCHPQSSRDSPHRTIPTLRILIPQRLDEGRILQVNGLKAADFRVLEAQQIGFSAEASLSPQGGLVGGHIFMN